MYGVYCDIRIWVYKYTRPSVIVHQVVFPTFDRVTHGGTRHAHVPLLFYTKVCGNHCFFDSTGRVAPMLLSVQRGLVVLCRGMYDHMYKKHFTHTQCVKKGMCGSDSSLSCLSRLH